MSMWSSALFRKMTPPAIIPAQMVTKDGRGCYGDESLVMCSIQRQPVWQKSQAQGTDWLADTTKKERVKSSLLLCAGSLHQSAYTYLLCPLKERDAKCQVTVFECYVRELPLLFTLLASAGFGNTWRFGGGGQGLGKEVTSLGYNSTESIFQSGV